MKKTFSEQYPELAEMSTKNKNNKNKENKNTENMPVYTQKQIETYKLYGSVTDMADFKI